MQALTLKGAKDFTYGERNIPERECGEVLIKIKAVSICGSDIHAIKGNQPMFTFPRVIGHEISAVVEDAGESVQLRKGDSVCVMPCIPCNTCIACKAGKTNCCTSLELYGVHKDGGLQEYMSLPERHLLKNPFPDQVDEAAIIEPLTIGHHAVSRMHLAEGSRILILGAGPIGAACAVCARALGMDVTLADINPSRREFVKHSFDFPVFHPGEKSEKKEMMDKTGREGYHGVIDTTANKASMEQAFTWLAHGGEIVFVGTFNGTLEINEAAFHMKEPSLHVTRNSTPDDYRAVIRLWREGRIDPGLFITDRISFQDAGTEILKWADGNKDVFKGIVRF